MFLRMSLSLNFTLYCKRSQLVPLGRDFELTLTLTSPPRQNLWAKALVLGEWMMACFWMTPSLETINTWWMGGTPRPPQFAFFSSEPSTHELEPGWLGPSIFSGAIPNGRDSVLFSGKWVEDRSLYLSAAFIWNLASATDSLGRMRHVNSLHLMGKLPFESWWKSESYVFYCTSLEWWAELGERRLGSNITYSPSSY